ncbi:uncharacterized protein LOC125038559 isoform X1 [Penaeus chinensis]|uniref:uncharacterized protein LOC125038559 isoform X1 n=1 Tax=Penaeus chinensis TaxID=139456 RepID=UPI001FB6DC63|nr:uncharacterized protein LOC125038559 isoform X1 [Penaeus chinensis]
MTVWQSRLHGTHIGIAVTRHLLQAKILDSDPTVSKELKSGANAIAITKFVSTIIKIPAARYHEAQSQSYLAEKIGLPVYLVDLRNEVNHGSRSWFGGQTVRMAVETCYKWIKDYYWDKEYAKCKKENKVADTSVADPLQSSDTATYTNADKSPPDTAEEPTLSTVNTPNKPKPATPQGLRPWEFAIEQLRCYCREILEKPRPMFSLLTEVLHAIQDKYEENPQECVDKLISVMFLPSYVENFGAKFANAGENDKCKCFFRHIVLQRYVCVMKIFNHFPGAMDLLIFSLLNKSSSEFQEISYYWVTMLVESELGHYCEVDRYHHFHFPYTNITQWKRLAEQLFLIGREWSYKLGLRIMESPKSNFTQDQINEVISLIKAYKMKRKAAKNEAESKSRKAVAAQKKKDIKEHSARLQEALQRNEEEINSEALEEWFSVNDVLKSSLDHSTFAFSIAEAVKKSLKTSENEDDDDVTPLGILPHQRGNPLFFKELLLHYPKECRGLPATDGQPPAKRFKC